MFWSSLLESLDDGAYLALGQTICYPPDARFRLHRSCADATRSSESFTSDLSLQQLSSAPQVVAEVRSVGVVSKKADQEVAGQCPFGATGLQFYPACVRIWEPAGSRSCQATLSPCAPNGRGEAPVRVLGVQCTSKFAFLSVVEDGQVIERGPSRLALAESTDQDQALWETLSTFETALNEISPDCVRLLLPGTGENAKQTYQAWAPRVELATLLRMAAAKRGLPVRQVSRASVLTKLGVPRRGKFEDSVRPAVPEQGSYWAAGRLAAAAAALAGADR